MGDEAVRHNIKIVTEGDLIPTHVYLDNKKLEGVDGNL